MTQETEVNWPALLQQVAGYDRLTPDIFARRTFSLACMKGEPKVDLDHHFFVLSISPHGNKVQVECSFWHIEQALKFAKDETNNANMWASDGSTPFTFYAFDLSGNLHRHYKV